MEHDGYKRLLDARARTVKVTMGPVKPLSSDTVGSIPTSPSSRVHSEMGITPAF
jgi:hypothetical protein